MSAPCAHQRRQRRILVLVALLFFGPLALSFFLYYGRVHWHPGGRVNAGVLVEPARPLPQLSLPLLAAGETDAKFLTRKWTFLYVQHGRCDDECLKQLYNTRQVRIALDREMNRVQRVLIADPNCCDLAALREANPDLISVAGGASAEPLLALLPVSPGSMNSHRIYLIDPLGNLMMYYAPEARPKGLLEDMKRLLRLSSIG